AAAVISGTIVSPRHPLTLCSRVRTSGSSSMLRTLVISVNDRELCSNSSRFCSFRSLQATLNVPHFSSSGSGGGGSSPPQSWAARTLLENSSAAATAIRRTLLRKLGKLDATMSDGIYLTSEGFRRRAADLPDP